MEILEKLFKWEHLCTDIIDGDLEGLKGLVYLGLNSFRWLKNVKVECFFEIKDKV